MLPAQIFSALAVSVCLMIDSVMIGRFLGETCMAAYGLSNPLLLVIGAIAMLMTTGIQVMCSNSLGRGSQEETNACFSSALAAGAAISVFFMVLVVCLRGPLATLTGAGTEGELYNQTRDYLLGFSVGAPACMGALVLVPFLQMAGMGTLLIAAVGAMVVFDVGLDLVNVYIWHAGMLGMGLASSISYYAALIIGSLYFFRKKCVFRFSRKQVSMRRIAELFRKGFPIGAGSIAAALLTFLLNMVLSASSGTAAVAALSVIGTIGGASNCITTGASGVSLTLSGILAAEEDRNGLRELIRTLCADAVILGLSMGAVLFFLAPYAAGLLIPKAGDAQDMAALGLRIFAAGLVPSFIMGSLRSLYQGTGKVKLMMIISILESLFVPFLVSMAAFAVLGTTGIWLYFALGEAVSLILLMVYIRIRTGSVPWKNDALLLLDPDFGVSDDALMEREIRTLQEANDVAREAEAFCVRHGQSARVANHIALCVEEMGANVIKHGFAGDSKPHRMTLRIQFKGDVWVIRFRDDCRAFDPVNYVPSEGKEAIGIRLVLALAEEATYTYAMNLNNLALRLRGTASD